MKTLERFGLEPWSGSLVSQGDVYNRLTIIAVGKVPGTYRYYAVVRCSCSDGLFRVRIDGIRNGRAGSCGCRQSDSTTKHGLWDHPLYHTWRNMMKRCYDPRSDRFKYYGERGIGVVGRWQDIRNFVTDMMPGFSQGMEIDRVDNDADYSPSNCRWATHAQQARNKRSLRYITIGDETKCMAEWARHYGHTRVATVKDRIKRGWNPVLAVTTPTGR